MDLVVFLLSASAIVIAGMRLAREGDVLATRTALGGLWVGAILVAGATSLPELTTDASAVWQGAPSLAVGDLFGSSMANMLILAVADLCTRHTRILTRVTVNQLAVGALGVTLTAIAAVGMHAAGPAIGGIGWATGAVGVGYVVGMRFLHRNRSEPPFGRSEDVVVTRARGAAVRPAAIRFALAALVVVVAAPALAWSTASLAGRLGISHGFAGVVLLAIATSLPEAVVTMTSVRSGSYDLAIGNLLGSNCFNMAALVALDVVDGGRSLLADVTPDLAVAALVGILLTALAMLGVLDRSERDQRRLELGPLVMILVYLAGLVLTYRSHG